MLPGAAGHFGSVAKAQRNSLTPFRASSPFTEAPKSAAEDAGELSSQRLWLGLLSFSTIPEAKATNKNRALLAPCSKSCSSALASGSLSCTPVW